MTYQITKKILQYFNSNYKKIRIQPGKEPSCDYSKDIL